ncbi:MAG: hypothetical protein ACR2GP_09525 [Burkholderiaceae bacterium]
MQTFDMMKFVRKGWSPLPGSPRAFFSSVSHDDAAGAVVAAFGVSAGAYNVADDEPLSRRDYVDALAEALGVAPPKFAPIWLSGLAGSLGKLMSRSQRISNRKLKKMSGWTPRYPSVREGWRATAAALQADADPTTGDDRSSPMSRVESAHR